MFILRRTELATTLENRHGKRFIDSLDFFPPAASIAEAGGWLNGPHDPFSGGTSLTLLQTHNTRHSQRHYDEGQ
jgi:hypothetical protein